MTVVRVCVFFFRDDFHQRLENEMLENSYDLHEHVSKFFFSETKQPVFNNKYVKRSYTA